MRHFVYLFSLISIFRFGVIEIVWLWSLVLGCGWVIYISVAMFFLLKDKQGLSEGEFVTVKPYISFSILFY